MKKILGCCLVLCCHVVMADRYTEWTAQAGRGDFIHTVKVTKIISFTQQESVLYAKLNSQRLCLRLAQEPEQTCSKVPELNPDELKKKGLHSILDNGIEIDANFKQEVQVGDVIEILEKHVLMPNTSIGYRSQLVYLRKVNHDK